MPLTRDFKEFVKARIERDPEFAQALFQEAMQTLVDGDVGTAKSVLRANSRGLQPCHLSLELEPQLRAFVLRQPAGHVRKDGPVHQEFVPVPGKLFRSPRFGQYLVQPRTNVVQIGPVGRRGRVGVEQFGLLVSLEQVLLGRTCHGSRCF
jgi:hypothetical protein